MIFIEVFAAKYLFSLLIAVLVASFWVYRGKTGRSFLYFLARFTLSILIVYTVSLIIGQLYPLTRPFVTTGAPPLFSVPTGQSLPSLESAYAAAAAIFFFLLNRKWGIIAFLVALTIGAALVVGNVNSPIDVAVGVLLGVVIGGLVIRVWPDIRV
jgi:undecaprenyl-diphosphatase